MKIRYYLFALAAMLMASCSEDSLDPQSIFPDETAQNVNEFDKWLMTNYVQPYNIQLKYRFEFKESDTEKNLSPARYDKAVALAKLTKYLWLESYEELLGRDFIRQYCPKIMHFIGSYGYNSGGSVTLGVAEGGMKITLYNVNNIDYNNVDIDFLNYWFFKTMHHEFAHILHQTKPYPTDFNEITASNYQSESWVNLENNEWLTLGFISDYASREPREDFVEIIANYITHDQAWWDAQMTLAGTTGAGYISTKLDIVRDWLKTAWNIDLDKLREIVQRRSETVQYLDLQTLN